MTPLPRWAGKLTQLATSRTFQRYLGSLDDPAGAQQALLARLIRDASRTSYAREFGLAVDDDLAAFSRKLPAATYEHFQPWVEQAIQATRPGVISPHKIVRVEATSGSSSGLKWIPYTRPMMQSFNRMFTLWCHDLLQHLYQPRTGRLFLCVTGGKPDPGIPKNYLGDDRDYLGKGWRRWLDRFVVAPRFAGDEDPLAKLATTLAAESTLEVMSFWSPSLLVAALDHLGITSAGEARRKWPHLQLISCWTAASSGFFVGRLRTLFPDVRIQGKGLLATEAAVTIPLEEAGGCLPLVDDVFLEFLSKDGEFLLLHELVEGREYEVIISNQAGLLRYRMGDRVKVTGFFRKTPMLEFIGRAGIVSDLVGEKLTLEFVENQLGPEVADYFCLLPDKEGYWLWIEGEGGIEAAVLEAALCRNFHYQRALRHGQLKPLELGFTRGLAEQVRRALEGDRARTATRAFKPPLLLADPVKAKRVNETLRRNARHDGRRIPRASKE